MISASPPSPSPQSAHISASHPTYTRFLYFAGKYPLGLAVIIALIVFTLGALLLPLQYETNDDPTVLLIASGHITGEPEARLVFINYFYGHVIRFLYARFPGPEWYTIAFCLLQLVAFTVFIQYLLTKPGLSRWLRSTMLATVVGLQWLLIARFQFTTTAAYLTAAGILLMSSEQHTWRGRLAGSGLCVLGALVRYHAAGMVMLIMAPLFIPVLRRHPRLILWPVAALLAAFLGYGLDARAYRMEPWTTYRAHIHAAQGVGRPSITIDSVTLPPGVETLDYAFFHGFFYDGGVINKETLQSIQKANPLLPPHPVTYLGHNLIRQRRFLMILGLLLLPILHPLLKRKTVMYGLAGLLMVGAALAVMSYLLLTAHIKVRVVHALAIAFLAAIFRNTPHDTGNKMSVAVSACLALFLGVYVIPAIGEAVRINQQHREQYAIQMEIIGAYPYPVAPLPGRLTSEGANPFALSQAQIPHLVRVGGWLTNYPHRFAPADNFPTWIDHMDFFMPTHLVPSISRDIQASLAHHYDMDVVAEIMHEEEGYSIVRFTR